MLKCSRRANVAAILGVVTTAPSGAPLPMPLAIVTMRYGILRFESPVIYANTPESGLDFIGDAHSACGAHMFVRVLQVSFRKPLRIRRYPGSIRQ